MKRIKAFWLALAIGLGISMTLCCVQAASQRQLSLKLIRLHILANSDSEEDQAVKLKVRDAVLKAGIDIPPDQVALKKLEEAAESCLADNGYDMEASASYEDIFIDTRDYDGFSLPAGYYKAVRIVIGEGKGRNWWCVVYPSLCTGFAEAEASGVLTDDELSYIKKEGEKYIFRFKIQEIISDIGEMLL